MNQTDNICKICGGLKKLKYTIAFEECRPIEIQVYPTPLSPFKFCPGHIVGWSDTANWEKLNTDQQYDVDRIRRRIGDYLIEQTEEFYKQHPELRISWSMTLDASFREDPCS